MGSLAHAGATDADLVATVIGGDHGAFEVLVRRHNQRMYRAARAVTRSDVDAEDVLQQAWLNVYRNLSHFRGDASFSTWVTRIAVHEAISVNRKRPVIAEVVDAPSDVTPVTEIDRAQLRAVLEQDTAETAELLGLTPEAVRVRLHRARAAIATVLTDLTQEIYRFDGARCDRITARVMSNVLPATPLPGA